MRRRLPAVLLFLLACPLAVHAAEEPAAAPTEPAKPIRAVIELFTSQGCTDCPAADTLLKSFADETDIIALTLPVDYWDYLGWKDTLASARNSERQRAYAKRFDTGPVSTPEAVINGAAHALGSSRDQIEQALKATETALSSRRIAVRAWHYGSNVVIEIGGATDENDVAEATIWLAVVQKRATVAVKYGDNVGKDLTYHNVVHEMTPVGLWNGRPTTIRLATGAVMHPESESLVVLLQENDNGPIIGAAKLAQ